jgi:hypothetical protein
VLAHQLSGELLTQLSRKLLGAATGLHPDSDLARQVIKMAVAARGGVDNIRGGQTFTPIASRPAGPVVVATP